MTFRSDPRSGLALLDERERPTPERSLLPALGSDAVAAARAWRLIDAGALDPAAVAGRFGSDVAALVASIATLDSLAGLDAPAVLRQKLLLAAVHDPRTVLIALELRAALLRDRLHDPDAAGRHQPTARLGREALDLHAPLAHRLGLTALKNELEDAAFRAAEPAAYEQLERILDQQPGASAAATAALVDRLAAELRGAGGLDVSVSGRRKSLWSLHRKLVAGRAIDDVYDLVGLRVVCGSEEECYLALAAIHARWDPVPGRLKDFISAPTANGYKSLHTTVHIDGTTVEVQLRTAEMHLAAEWGIAAHWLYKSRPKPSGTGRSARAGAATAAAPPPSDPIAALASLQAELLGDECFAITPLGKVLALPVGATPVDFAYAIHTDVGHRCKAARVDGKLHRLSAPLSRVSTVEILCGARAGPSREWLVSVRTGRARSKIRAWFRTHEEREQRRIGQARLRRGLLAESLAPDNELVTRSIASTATGLGFANADELVLALGSGAMAVGRVTRLVARAVAASTPPESPAKPRPAKARRAPHHDGPVVVVDGKVTLSGVPARCCRPLPGQAVVGYVGSGGVLRIHRLGCPELALAPGGADRLVSATWPEERNQRVDVRIEIETAGQADVARDVQEAVAAAKGELVALGPAPDARRRAGRRLVVSVRVDSVEQFDAVRERLAALPEVSVVVG